MRRSSRLESQRNNSVRLEHENPPPRAHTNDSGAEDEPSVQSPDDILHDKCSRVLELLKDLGLSFGEFIVAVCFGNPVSRSPEAMWAARKSLYQTDCLAKFLKNSHCPPRPRSHGGPRPVAGTNIINKFAAETMSKIYASELKAFGEDFTVNDVELANADVMSRYTSSHLHETIQSMCPQLYATLRTLTGDVIDEDINDNAGEGEDLTPPLQKHPHFGIVIQVASLAYRLHQRHNGLQKYLSIYMQAQHLSKSGFFLLQQAGVVMSYSWTRRAIDIMAKDLKTLVENIAKIGPLAVVHDNIRIGFPVRSQRGDNQSVADNGTAVTILHLPPSAHVLEEPSEFKEFMHSLKARRIAGTAPQLSWNDLFCPKRLAYNRSSSIHDILDIIRLIPELSGCDFWKSDQLKRPVGLLQLPHGPEHRLRQHMLPTTNIDESSYSGNSQIIPYVLQQLKLDSADEQPRLALDRLFIWIGDQLTVQRCRQVQSYRQESLNGYERWDSLRFFFGGFHMLMNLSGLILENFRGSNVGPTLASDIILLSRQGLQKTEGKKVKDYHTVDEFLLHECEAHFRGLFMHLTGCDSGEKLAEWAATGTADNILHLANTMLRNHASSAALELDESGDELRQVIIMRQQELLLYHSLRRAYKHGDVDRIEALLPELLIYFTGAGSGNYAQEVFEFLQLITHECTPEIRNVLLQHGLVVNRLGRANSFFPIDQLQEHNNAGIRNYGPPPQNATWEQYGKISRVIPFFTEAVEHVEGKVCGHSRSHIHKDPKREMDVQVLITSHKKHTIHQVDPERTVKKQDKPKDYII